MLGDVHSIAPLQPLQSAVFGGKCVSRMESAPCCLTVGMLMADGSLADAARRIAPPQESFLQEPDVPAVTNLEDNDEEQDFFASGGSRSGIAGLCRGWSPCEVVDATALRRRD